jgi:hypothetical protein
MLAGGCSNNRFFSCEEGADTDVEVTPPDDAPLNDECDEIDEESEVKIERIRFLVFVRAFNIAADNVLVAVARLRCLVAKSEDEEPKEFKPFVPFEGLLLLILDIIRANEDKSVVLDRRDEDVIE